MATNRTALFSRRQPGGVFTIDDLREHPGDIWFVDSTNSDASDTAGFGKNPDAPFATIDYAVGKCTASNGDVIYVMPGHAETLAAAGAITMDVAGVSVIGLGTGDQQPTLTFATAAAASIVVSADDCYMSNLHFVGNIASQNHMIDLAADDFTIEDCFFQEGSAQGLTFITADTDDGDSAMFVCRRNFFLAPSDGWDAAIVCGKDHGKWLIEDNDIYGDFDEAGIEVPADGNASAWMRIYRNRITNLAADQHAIQIEGASVTGWAVDNQFQTNAQATAFDSSALSCHGNTWVDTDGSADEEAVPANAQHATTTQLVGLQDGAIVHGTFAADSIRAAAIQDNAIDAGAIAANAITDAKINADAITEAKIADNAFASEHFALSAGEFTGDGIVATRATAALPQTGSDSLFTVTGHVLLKRIVGVVTVAIGNVANATKLVMSPTGAGADTDLCATADIDDDAQDTIYTITGTFANGMVATTNLPVATAVDVNVLLPPGTIDINCAGNDGGDGRVRWSVLYQPLESGAQVVAA